MGCQAHALDWESLDKKVFKWDKYEYYKNISSHNYLPTLSIELPWKD